MTTADQLAGLGRYEYGWGRLGQRGCHGTPWPQRGGRARHLGEEERAGVDARAAPEGPAALRQASRCRRGDRT